MILILGSLSEVSTDIVIDWLDNYSVSFVRFKDSELLFTNNKFSLFDDTNFFTSQNKKINLSEIKVVWYRKFGFYGEDSLEDLNTLGIKIDILSHLRNEYNSLVSLFINELNRNLKIKWLTNPLIKKDNKIYQLISAKKIGISVPDTLITGSKEELYDFYKRKKRSVIAKSIKDIRPLKNLNNSHDLIIYTCEVTDQIISSLPDNFFPSFFQEKIEKEFEIRSFFLDNKFYSMAIFSQNDEQTTIDFRRYNFKKQNRMIPYQLPNSIEVKLRNLLHKLNIDTGSIDIIKATNGEYIFLEINPTGQYGFVSYNCNYQLDKKIAIYLLNLNKNE